MDHPGVVVVGAGVSGLTTAVALAEAGHSVRVVAELAPHETTSAMAGAIWTPGPLDDARTPHWGAVTLAALHGLADVPRSGVRIAAGLEVSAERDAPPEWARQVQGYRPWSAAEGRMHRRYRSGWRYQTPLVDMPVYLDHLVDRLKAAGGSAEFGRRIDSLAELRGEADLVVNCTGLGARDLVPDDRLYATRGQLVVVENPGIEEFFQDDADREDLTYILPHGDHVVLGGCAMSLAGSGRPSTGTADEILRRCIAVEPRLRGAAVIGYRVGLRPCRDEVRLERSGTDGHPAVIHNYGHGSIGVSLSWGCADAVLRLIG
jgi:D-amino-acid oxidase